MNYPNPHARKSMTGGSISVDPVQKNKSRAPRKRIMKNRGQGTRHVPGPLRIPKKNAGGYYPHTDGLEY